MYISNLFGVLFGKHRDELEIKIKNMLLFLPIVIVIISLVFGYFFWKNSKDNYGYNVFNIGVVIRLIVGLLVCVVSLEIGMVILCFCLVWNVVVVYRNTSFIIALLFLLFFQPAALLFAFWILNRKWD